MNYFITVYKNMFWLSKRNVFRDVSFTCPNLMFDTKRTLIIIILGVIYFYVHLPIIQTTVLII